MTWPPSPRVRRWAYGVATAGLTVAGAYGLVSGEQLAAWMGLAAAVTGMAATLVTEDPPPGPDDAAPPRRAL